ncbi:CRM-domain containing factor CFM3, chloroplastic/mitochondrial [Iris pallida]|uniref:CRM-domain containing factor CFM3, chloroplastic/mitochondrial n=1 Tax=Iris pallida TaxID=29817 RepID=A0AAX6EVH7_IRIPA|nr:CRM-domain containing factor CFM3, chloroplastic/mitochondrial [Iris pallida]
MALSTIKFSELPFHAPAIHLYSRPPLLSFSLLRFRFKLLFSTSASPSSSPHVADQNPNPNLPKPPSAPWLHHWDPPPPPGTPPPPSSPDPPRPSAGPDAIERIVHRLRNLGPDLLDEEEEEEPVSRQTSPPTGSENLGELLNRTWTRPDLPSNPAQSLLPWERGGEQSGVLDGKGEKRRRMKAPTLAELTIEDEELRRLRRTGMTLRERITIPKAGVTQAILENIHDGWRRSELVRLKFHESLAQDMKTAHEIVERRTGGLVIWRAGSVMVVYRGSSYKRPPPGSQHVVVETTSANISHEGDTLFVPDVSGVTKLDSGNDNHAVSLSTEKTRTSQTRFEDDESLTEEEEEYNRLLDGLGPRFVDWWGTGLLPVDADLLPQNIPGYRTPFRLLPTGMRSRLTNAEMTNLRKLARKLPCHFALGRNRHHHGLAAAILKLWEKSLVVKIAVKRGIQNTNNKLMAEELKTLTGGILLLRNKYYIVMYRGKDFVPTAVGTALTEREQLTKDVQEIEEKARNCIIGDSSSDRSEGHALAGTLAEFREAQARWGREVSAEEHMAMKEEASKSESLRLFKRIDHKLTIAQAKKVRAERLLAKIETSMVPITPSDDREMITDEERSNFRSIALRMKAYLPLGIRGVFDGVIENMHLHWKHRELVKLISKQKTLSFVEDTARLLEYESGGILVAVERVPKGYALVYYRGKNYQRPISLRPRNLLTKAKALKRSVAMQRHEALSQHITELEKTIKQIKFELGYSGDEESNGSNQVQSGHTSDYSEVEDDDFFSDSEEDYDSDKLDENDGYESP